MEPTESEYFRYLQKQAKQGDPAMQFELGDYYWQKHCFDKAGYWHALAAGQWEKKAKEGDNDSRYRLAHCYLNADGVPWSYDKAIYWLEKAAKQKHSHAQEELLSLLLFNDRKSRYFYKTLYWYFKLSKAKECKMLNRLKKTREITYKLIKNKLCLSFPDRPM